MRSGAMLEAAASQINAMPDHGRTQHRCPCACAIVLSSPFPLGICPLAGGGCLGKLRQKVAQRIASRSCVMPRKTATNDPAALNMSDIFGPGGMLEKVHPGYEFRSSQLEMAEMVAEAFEKRQHTIVEAGTGTGKTLAYLVPALRSGRRVI